MLCQRAILVGIKNGNRIAVAIQFALHGSNHQGIILIHDIGYNDPDNGHGMHPHPLRHNIRCVVQLPHHFAYPLFCRGGVSPAFMNHTGNSGDGYAGEPGNLLHGYALICFQD